MTELNPEEYIQALITSAAKELELHGKSLNSFSLEMPLPRAFNLIFAINTDMADAKTEREKLITYFSQFPACKELLTITGLLI